MKISSRSKLIKKYTRKGKGLKGKLYGAVKKIIAAKLLKKGKTSKPEKIEISAMSEPVRATERKRKVRPVKAVRLARRGKRIFMPRYGINENIIINLIAVIVLIFLAVYIKSLIFESPKKGNINADSIAAFSLSPDAFNSIRELSVKYNIDFYEMLSLYCIECSFHPSKEINIRTKDEIEQTFAVNYKNIKKNYKNKVIKQYSEMIKNVFDEIKYFPIMADSSEKKEDCLYIYGDSWGSPREYKGSRKHEGCDIMDRDNIRGRVGVCSMTDGVIENIGWNELGGYRVGIKTVNGTYYYYAHLDRFAEGLNKGSEIRAGQIIGFMGDTGYGKKEGTRGNFAVHLHVGIMLETKIKKDYWINPYPFLRYIENKSIGN